MSKAVSIFANFRSHLQILRPVLVSNRSCSTFKSPIHTDFLYPGSKSSSKFDKYDLAKLPTKDQTFSGHIPMAELDFKYSLSSGPGGQNIQKNMTKVDIRFKLDSASWLSDEVKQIVADKYAGQLTKDGYLVVKSDRTRSQLLNQADALQKLRHFIWSAVDEVRTYLERTQVDQVEAEKRLKAQQKAARERIKFKRMQSSHANARKGNFE